MPNMCPNFLHFSGAPEIIKKLHDQAENGELFSSIPGLPEGVDASREFDPFSDESYSARITEVQENYHYLNLFAHSTEYISHEAAKHLINHEGLTAVQHTYYENDGRDMPLGLFVWTKRSGICRDIRINLEDHKAAPDSREKQELDASLTVMFKGLDEDKDCWMNPEEDDW